MDILITAPDGRTATTNIDHPNLALALSRVFNAGLSEQHTARAMEAHHSLRDGNVVSKDRWKFEPITDAEVSV